MVPTPLLLLIVAAAEPAATELQTAAEASGWRETTTPQRVVELMDRIARRSARAQRAELGRSVEGRSIPLLILADPPLRSPAEARASGRAVVFAFGNIHAGEVCGKEALLMLGRELALEADHPLLDELVVILCPNLNPDGDARRGPGNRPGQVGPVGGMGERPNAQGLDLNRDYVKLETPEIRALVRLLTQWRPELTIDCHTTNGSRHRYTLTYAAPLNPSGHRGSIGLLRDELLPEVTRRLRRRTGYETFFYGNFGPDRRTWRTYSARPRFGGPYRGLRGRMSILSEAYAYAPYRDRVLATLEFVREILRYAAEHRAGIVQMNARARAETIEAGRNPQPHDVVGIRHAIAAFPEPSVIKAFAEDGSGAPADVRVVHLGRFEPVMSVRRPHAYLVAGGLVDEILDRHGIERRRYTGRAAVEAYTVTALRRAEEPFQGHRLVTVDVRADPVERHFENATLVPTAQPLGTLAVYLLEPAADDGLAAWSFFDEHLAVGAEFPVYRVARE